MEPGREPRPQFRTASDLIAQLERADVHRVGKALAAERGVVQRPPQRHRRNGANPVARIRQQPQRAPAD